MATNTPRMNFILPDDGGDNDIWDNHLNKNWTDTDLLIAQLVELMNIQDPVGTIKLLDNSVALPVAWALMDGRIQGGYPTIDMRNRVAVGVGSRQPQNSAGGSIYWSDDSPPTNTGADPKGAHGHFVASNPTAWLMRGNGTPPGDFGYSDSSVSDHAHIQRQQYWASPGRWIVKYRKLTVADLRAVSV